MDEKIVLQDFDRLLESAQFSDIVRYRHAHYWKRENRVQDILESQPNRHLESDSEHSWQIADMVLLLGPHWPELNLSRALGMAVLHDKVEIFTGDAVVTGQSGDGSDSHAFNDEIKKERQLKEAEAQRKYLDSLPGDSRKIQEEILSEYEMRESAEAKFVDALDKLQTLIWALHSQRNYLSDLSAGGALEFSERYKKPRIAGFPALLPYYEEAMKRLKKGAYGK